MCCSTTHQPKEGIELAQVQRRDIQCPLNFSGESLMNRRDRLSSIACVFWLVALVACGANGKTDSDEVKGTDSGLATGSLTISPQSVILEASSGEQVAQDFVVTYTDDAGKASDVTNEVSLSLELPYLGGFTGGTFQSNADRAGRSRVFGSYQGSTAEAEVAILLAHTIVEPGAEEGPELFGGAVAGGAEPQLVYPASGIIVPPNLNTLEFHFRPGAGNDLFELEFTGSLVRIRLYTRCTALSDGCVFEPDSDVWDLLATASRGEAPVFYSLRALNSTATTPSFGISQTSTVQFSYDEMQGGIYYWNANPGSIQRYDFGRRGQSAENYLNVSQTAGTTCVGCHSLSRAGDRIAVGYDVPGPAGIETFDVATRASLWAEGGAAGSGGANFATFPPDSSRILTGGTGPLYLRNTNDGGGKTEVISNGTMPDWAPDNSRVVFAQGAADGLGDCPIPGFCDIDLPGGGFGGNPGVDSGSIVAVVPDNWGNETTLAPADGKNNYYPAFSPDSNWVVYNRSGLNSYDAPDAQVWVVAASGGQSIRLETASPSPGGDSWPKWAPFQHGYQDGNEIMWLTFSSRRDYGLRLQNSVMLEDDRRAQIWMVGFDPARAAAGQDGSFAAFWLPFQDMSSGNHIAQWVEEIERQPCGDNECPSGEFCEGGSCVPPIQ